jgi:hypothetical protein
LAAASVDGGRTFGPLRKVTEVPSLALGGHRGPRIVAAGDVVVVSAVVGMVGGGKDGDLVAWRSTDQGGTWSAPVTVSDVPDAAREGLHAMAARGRFVAAAWLDLRGTGTRLYGATSSDAGKTWSPNVLVYQSPSGTICQCCHPSLAMADDGGTVLAMFRNVVNGHRDLYLSKGRDGHFGTAEKLGDGSWELDACPMDGGELIADAEGNVTTVWRREETVYLDVPGSPEVQVGRGVNPAVVSTPDGPVVAWTAPNGLTLAAPDRDALVLDASGKFVSLAWTGRSTVAAWEHGDTVQTRVIPQVAADARSN